MEISPTFVSNITEAVIDEVRQWQNRPLEQVYPIVYVDCLVVKVRKNLRIINRALYLTLGVGMEGQKELLACGWVTMRELAVWLALFDFASESRTQGHLYCLCGWTHRLT